MTPLLRNAVLLLFVLLTGCGSGGSSSDGEPGPMPADAAPVGGKFGDKCTCPGPVGSGEFECSGTNICSAGLSCIGQVLGGVQEGKCRGPTCCSGLADCAAVLGTQATCGAGQECVCPRGDLECVGTKCTCEAGIPATRGLCYPD